MNLQEFQNTVDDLIVLYKKWELLKWENTRLREALKVYADLEYWGAVQGDDQEFLFRESIGQKTYVQGKRARAALKEE